jgi:uncharacterized protein
LEISQDLEWLQREMLDKEEENLHFREYLRARDPGQLDAHVQRLNEEIAPQVDCTACGNCCKSLMVNITPVEVVKLAVYLEKEPEDVMEQYVETSLQGNMVLNSMPCPFLAGTRCGIYEDRFTECREFPSLHQPGFRDRLFPTFMHYGRCPIIYNVVEKLKVESGFC